jgi:hypothetical protein
LVEYQTKVRKEHNIKEKLDIRQRIQVIGSRH